MRGIRHIQGMAFGSCCKTKLPTANDRSCVRNHRSVIEGAMTRKLYKDDDVRMSSRVLQNELTTARINCQEPERKMVVSMVGKGKNSGSLTRVMTQVRGECDRILQTIREIVSEVETRWELKILQDLGIEGSSDAAK